MRTSTDCTSRADECRRLAKPEDWGHFLEMAETWELLAKQRNADEQVADEEVADKQLADKQVGDGQVAAQEVADEQVVAQQVADEEIADEEIADEQLAAVLALVDGIANSRNLGLQ